jgi:hypothetical protein
MPWLAVNFGTTTLAMQQGGRRPKRGRSERRSTTAPIPARFCRLGSRAGWSSRRPRMWSSTPQRVLSPLITSGSLCSMRSTNCHAAGVRISPQFPGRPMRCCGGGCTMNYSTISAQRIAGALGAEIAGVDLSRPLCDERSCSDGSFSGWKRKPTPWPSLRRPSLPRRAR